MAAMTAKDPARAEPHKPWVFLNFPYDVQFVRLYLAYIAGVCSFGLTPRVALELAGGERRLDRIIDLILGCRYSFHDLSRVELDRRRPQTPRMNMPFELGLTVMASYRNPKQHTWCIFEKDYRRALKSVGDLAGSDVYSHGARPTGVLREIANALVAEDREPDIRQLMAVYRDVRAVLPSILKKRGTKSLLRSPATKQPCFGTWCTPHKRPPRIALGPLKPNTHANDGTATLPP